MMSELGAMNNMVSQVQRTVFISDGTAITAETLGHAVLSFPLSFISYTLPFVTSKLVHMKLSKNRYLRRNPVASFSVLFDYLPEVKQIITQSAGFAKISSKSLVAPIQKEVGLEPEPKLNRTHGLSMQNMNQYDARIAAIEYTLAHDDGISLRNLDQAQVILIGVSRCGKTPTSFYLAMQFGIQAANYPFTADDMDNLQLPAALRPYTHKLFGLTISPERLAAIREERENSRYASIRQCRIE